MSDLVEQLRREHSEIVRSLDRVKAHRPTSQEGRAELRASRAGLLAHLATEDAELYPVLLAAAASDPAVGRVVASFSADAEAISRFADDFFQRYEHGADDGVDFARDFAALYAMLKNRIRREEEQLYAEYERLRG